MIYYNRKELNSGRHKLNTHVKLFGSTVIVLYATWSIATATPAQADVPDETPAAISATTEAPAKTVVTASKDSGDTATVTDNKSDMTPQKCAVNASDDNASPSPAGELSAPETEAFSANGTAPGTSPAPEINSIDANKTPAIPLEPTNSMKRTLDQVEDSVHNKTAPGEAPTTPENPKESENTRLTGEEESIIPTNSLLSAPIEPTSEEMIFIASSEETNPISLTNPVIQEPNTDNPYIRFEELDDRTNRIEFTIGDNIVTLTKKKLENGTTAWVSNDTERFPVSGDGTEPVIILNRQVQETVSGKIITAIAHADSVTSEKTTLQLQPTPTATLNLQPNTDKVTLTVAPGKTVTLTKNTAGEWISNDPAYTVSGTETQPVVTLTADSYSENIRVDAYQGTKTYDGTDSATLSLPHLTLEVEEDAVETIITDQNDQPVATLKLVDGNWTSDNPNFTVSGNATAITLTPDRNLLINLQNSHLSAVTRTLAGISESVTVESKTQTIQEARDAYTHPAYGQYADARNGDYSSPCKVNWYVESVMDADDLKDYSNNGFIYKIKSIGDNPVSPGAQGRFEVQHWLMNNLLQWRFPVATSTDLTDAKVEIRIDDPTWEPVGEDIVAHTFIELSDGTIRHFFNYFTRESQEDYPLDQVITKDKLQHTWRTDADGVRHLTIEIGDMKAGDNLVFQFTGKPIEGKVLSKDSFWLGATFTANKPCPIPVNDIPPAPKIDFKDTAVILTPVKPPKDDEPKPRPKPQPEEPTPVPPVVTPEQPETPEEPEIPEEPEPPVEIPEEPEAPKPPAEIPESPEKPEDPNSSDTPVKDPQKSETSSTPKTQPIGTKEVPKTGDPGTAGALWLSFVSALGALGINRRRK